MTLTTTPVARRSRYVIPSSAYGAYIRAHVPFTNAGRTFRGYDRAIIGYRSWLSPRESAAYQFAADGIDYTVVSYNTAIAWHDSRGWHIITRTFSPTTRQHQGTVNAALYPRDDFVEVVSFTPYDLTPRQREVLAMMQSHADYPDFRRADYGNPSVGLRREARALARLVDKGYLKVNSANQFILTGRGVTAYV